MLIDTQRIEDFLKTHSCHIINKGQTLEDKMTYADFVTNRYESVFKQLQTDIEVERAYDALEDVLFIENKDGNLVLAKTYEFTINEKIYSYEAGTLREPIWEDIFKLHSKGAEFIYSTELKGASKEDILRYVSKFYTEENIINPKLSLKEYHNIKTKIPVEFSVTCMHTVPLAVRCFYESRNFEDCITKAIMASMDADTCAAIAGSLAAVYYKTFNANTTYAWGNKYKEEINAMINN